MIYAAWHAMKGSELSARGAGGGRQASGVLHVFCLKLAVLLAGTAPGLGGRFDRVIVVFDGGRDADAVLPHSRESLTAHLAPEARYKAARPTTTDPDLRIQLDAARQACDAMGVPWARSAPGYEADDLIGALCDPAHLGARARIVVVTQDKDLCQLIRDAPDGAADGAADGALGGPSVAVAHAVRGSGAYVVLSEADFSEDAVDEAKRKDADAGGGQRGARSKRAFAPVHPRSLADFLALVGDPSDGIRGVEGIGPVRAKQVLDAADAHFRSLDGAGAPRRPFADALAPDADGGLPHLDAIIARGGLPKSTSAALRDPEQQRAYRLARDLVALRVDTCPVPPDLAPDAVLAPDREPLRTGEQHRRLHAYCDQWGLETVRAVLTKAGLLAGRSS